MLRLHWIAVISALLLCPAVYAAPQQSSADPNGTPQGSASQSSPSAQSQDDDQGPPTLRYNIPGSLGDSETDKKPAPKPTQPSANPPANQPITPPPPNAPPLNEATKLQLLRYVDGEFAKVLAPLPGTKGGFHIKAGLPLDQDALHKALMADGAALNVGDSVQITKMDFHGRQIQFDINGGPKGHTSWRDRIHLEGSGGLPVSTTTTTTPENAPVVQQKAGATIYLDFDRDIPEMTGDQLKAYLGKVLDFSKRSAAVQYAESLPPKMREAIAQKRAEVGMDHDEVTAAMGRPERKVRERDADGNEFEDWIYGAPPQKTTFVTFEGDKVVRVAQYP